jgi:ribonuclease D
LVDPLSEIDLAPFLGKLDTKLLVLHGADYDLRMLFQLNGFRPYRIFDTMLAAQLLGKAGFGLAALVQAYFEISLPKDQQKADWSSRPLSPSMLEYGAQDTFFLPGLYATLTAELTAKNRLSWHEETCRELVKATAKIREVDQENAWRIEGSARLYPRQLAALQSMWKYRDQIARTMDLPAYRILPSDVLLRFSIAVPPDGDPENIPSLPSRLSSDLKTGFLEAFHSALSLPPEDWPKIVRPPKKTGPSPNFNLVNHLKEVRDGIAKELGLDPSLLATKSMLANVALTGCTSRAKMREAAKWMSWQEELLLDAWLKPKEPSLP